MQHREFDRLGTRLRAHLDEAAELGQIGANVDLDLVTHHLVALIDGVSAERVLYPDRVPPQRQIDLLDQLLAGLQAGLAVAAVVQTGGSPSSIG